MVKLGAPAAQEGKRKKPARFGGYRPKGAGEQPRSRKGGVGAKGGGIRRESQLGRLDSSTACRLEHREGAAFDREG